MQVRDSLATVAQRKLNSDDVLHCLTDLFVTHGPPEHIRSDNGSEFTAQAVRKWLERTGVRTLYIEPRAALGKTDTVRVSMASSETNYSTGRSSIPSRKPSYSSNGGEWNITVLKSNREMDYTVNSAQPTASFRAVIPANCHVASDTTNNENNVPEAK